MVFRDHHSDCQQQKRQENHHLDSKQPVEPLDRREHQKRGDGGREQREVPIRDRSPRHDSDGHHCSAREHEAHSHLRLDIPMRQSGEVKEDEARKKLPTFVVLRKQLGDR